MGRTRRALAKRVKDHVAMGRIHPPRVEAAPHGYLVAALRLSLSRLNTRHNSSHSHLVVCLFCQCMRR